jgi:hypothetical protein
VSNFEPIVHWKYNDGTDAPPPVDAEEWMAVCRALRLTWAEFVLHEQGRWHISRAEGLLEGETYADRRRDLARALLAKNLPLDPCCKELGLS